MKSSKFQVTINKQNNWYVLKCPSLGIVSLGYVLPDALENMKKAIGLYFGDNSGTVT